MGKNAKPKTKKDKVIKQKAKSEPVGTYIVERLVESKWTDAETVKAKGRKALMGTLKGQVRVRAAS